MRQHEADGSPVQWRPRKQHARQGAALPSPVPSRAMRWGEISVVPDIQGNTRAGDPSVLVRGGVGGREWGGVISGRPAQSSPRREHRRLEGCAGRRPHAVMPHLSEARPPLFAAPRIASGQQPPHHAVRGPACAPKPQEPAAQPTRGRAADPRRDTPITAGKNGLKNSGNPGRYRDPTRQDPGPVMGCN